MARRVMMGLAPMAVLVAVLAVMLGAGAALAERRVALVIGNGGYASLSTLRNPANDARDMAAALDGLGFALVGGKAQVDLRRGEMVGLIRQFANAVTVGDVALFYYAGHGAQHAGENYLIPVDDREITHREDLPDWAVGVDTVRRQLESAGAVTALLFLDACRNTPLPSRIAGRGVSRGLARIQEIPGSFIAFAAAPGQEAADGAGRNGLFTGALLKALGNPARRIEDIFMETAVEVVRQSPVRQQPWSSSSLERPFYFRPAAPGAEAAVVAFQAMASSNNPADFEVFARSFPNHPLAAVAAQRAVSLRESKLAAVVSPAPLPVPPPVIQPAVGVFPPPKRAGEVFKDCVDCPEMVVIPAGSFQMGSPDNELGRFSDEGPQHKVSIDRSFAVGRYEVTQAEWVSVMGSNPSKFQGERNPVETVSWVDAQEYARRLSAKTGQRYRLLTEAEWEYAARGGTVGPFSTGATITTAQANFDGNYSYNGSGKGEYRRQPVPVGKYPANGFGLHDMHGNVWEWVEDCYADKHLEASTDGSAVTGKNFCQYRVMRGGSWFINASFIRSARRGMGTLGYRDNGVGFRLAKALTP